MDVSGLETVVLSRVSLQHAGDNFNRDTTERKVHFKQLGTELGIQIGVYSTSVECQAKGGSPDQWLAELDVREWGLVMDVLKFDLASAQPMKLDRTLWAAFTSSKPGTNGPYCGLSLLRRSQLFRGSLPPDSDIVKYYLKFLVLRS
jgi:hypothetical protein